MPVSYTHLYNGAPPVASRDWAIFDQLNNNSYVFLDPANCANIKNGFDGTVNKYNRPGKGDYCGSMYTPGYRTLKNGKESVQFYAHSTYDLNRHAQLYADVFPSHQKVKYHVGSGYTWWGTIEKLSLIHI